MKKLALLIVVLVCGATASPAFGQATRTWVTGAGGSDANPCSRTAPCQTFAGAISKTFINGEINVIDSGGFGTVTITKSVTIDGAGHHASILASGTNGINIRIPEGPFDPQRRVVLRNLAINGTGASGMVGTATGLNGINVIAEGASTIELENVRIGNFTQNGIRVAADASSPAQLNMTLDNVFVSDILGNAMDLRTPDGSHTVNALARNSAFKHTRLGPGDTAGESGIGISADTGTHVWLTGSQVFDNAIGLKTFARQGTPGVIDSFCDNQIAGNADNGTAPNELCPKPVTLPGEQVTVNVPVTQCVVPNLRGLKVAFARKLLKAAHCALGKVTRKRAKKRSQRGKVISQKTKAGTALAEGTKVNVTVGRR